jgi:trk system potassium uptake protein TrkH
MSVLGLLVRACRALGASVRAGFVTAFQLVVAAAARLKPAQLLTLGFLSYVLVGALLLSTPHAQVQDVSLLDNLFNVTSAVSTTGLTTVSVGDSYTLFGQFVLLALFQLGGIGYMTISSFVLLARGKVLSQSRLGVLRTEFALPKGLDLMHFVRQLVVFTVVIELLGTLALYGEFRAAGVDRPLWSALFHCVSAFATAGFSLNNDSLERFRGNFTVCATIGILSYMGAIGFIVIQDAWRAVRSRAIQLTFTSKVILIATGLILLISAPLLYFTDNSLQQLPPAERATAAAFQIMTASSTAGFNTVSIAGMNASSLVLITIAMIIGASPSGTGGGIKTTTLSSLLAVLLSTLRGRQQIVFWNHEIPLVRILTATASATIYLTFLALGVYLLCLVEQHDFLSLVFEAASALGTVGLSLGITGSLSAKGKLLVTLLMFVGRVGPLTVGLAFFPRGELTPRPNHVADLAV